MNADLPDLTPNRFAGQPLKETQGSKPAAPLRAGTAIAPTKRSFCPGRAAPETASGTLTSGFLSPGGFPGRRPGRSTPRVRSKPPTLRPANRRSVVQIPSCNASPSQMTPGLAAARPFGSSTHKTQQGGKPYGRPPSVAAGRRGRHRGAVLWGRPDSVRLHGADSQHGAAKRAQQLGRSCAHRGDSGRGVPFSLSPEPGDRPNPGVTAAAARTLFGGRRDVAACPEIRGAPTTDGSRLGGTNDRRISMKHSALATVSRPSLPRFLADHVAPAMLWILFTFLAIWGLVSELREDPPESWSRGTC